MSTTEHSGTAPMPGGPNRRHHDRAAARPNCCQLGTLLLTAALGTVAGCEDRQEQRAAASTPAAPPVVTVSLEQQSYERYRATIGPIVEELMRMRATNGGAGVDADAFRRQHPEAKLRHRQADMALTAADRARQSWTYIETAMRLMEGAEELLQRIDQIEAEVRAESPRHDGPAATASREETHKWTLKLIDYVAETEASSRTAAQSIVAAGTAIQQMEQALKDGK
ncbi:MAG TPA: hypothetical protein VGN72_01655 [Tepidisphaeraceae bacterium]|jgi:hypothetical protein|nr:hypothetical protein [Tepidisphaeraceae bacterium]